MNERNFPFNQMEKRQVDGNNYVFLPNIWVRNEKLAPGATREECFAYMISDKPKTGYHIHPSFMTNAEILLDVQKVFKLTFRRTKSIIWKI